MLGAQSMKFGYQGGYLMDNRKSVHQQPVPAVPDSTTASRTSSPRRSTAFRSLQRVRYDAFYAQEQWTLGRMTLQGALRSIIAWSIFPEAEIGGVRFLPDA